MMPGSKTVKDCTVRGFSRCFGNVLSRTVLGISPMKNLVQVRYVISASVRRKPELAPDPTQ